MIANALPDEPNPRQLIAQMVRQEIEKLRRQKSVIDSVLVARRVVNRLDEKRKAPAEVTFAAIEGVAQIARPLLRHHLDPPEPDDEKQIDAFSKKLQDHYSIKRPKEWAGSRYVPREEITKREIERQVIPTLQRCRDAYAKHIDLLQEWNSRRPDIGV